MAHKDVLQKLQDVFDSVFDEKVVVTKDLAADQVKSWDSMKQISLIFAIETKFGIRFPLQQIDQLRNVGELIQMIENHSISNANS